jgi:tetratricopeptide (TPR) repeat protein
MKKWLRQLHKGIEAVKRGDLDQAEAYYRETLRLNPSNTDALLNLSGIYYHRRSFDKALKLVEECITADPTRPQAHHQRGMVRSAMGDLNGALSDFDLELQLHPDDLEAILSRGVTLSKLGNTTDALASYEHAMRLAPQDPRPYHNRGLLREESDPVGALSDFSEAIICDPSYVDAYIGRGFLLRAKGAKQEALADFRAFLHYNNGPRLHKSYDLVQSWVRELETEVSDTAFPTPLSDLIEDLHFKPRTEDSFADFLQAFRYAVVGVIALGVPPATRGNVTSMPEHRISLGSSTDSEGHASVLAFADPDAFVRTFGTRFNATMSGETVLQTVVQNPACYGLQVNSAKTELSILIDRHTVVSLLAPDKAAPASSQRPWWKFW